VTVPSTIVLSAHFPPSMGGVQRFAWELVRRLPADRVVVVTLGGDTKETAAIDRRLPFRVVRRSSFRRLSQDLAAIVAEHGCTAGWIPAMAPVGLFAASLRRAGVERIVASTHGQELGWLRAAPSRGALRHIASSIDVLTFLNSYTGARLAPVVGDVGLHTLRGGVDAEAYAPAAAKVRSGLRPRIISVGRLVRRKGHDHLIRAWPQVLSRHPDAVLTIVGSGPYGDRLHRLAAQLPKGSIELVGCVDEERKLALLGESHVFVTPSRDDRLGLQTEGLGLVTLEGSAAGLPVVVGRSGGSVDSVVDGVTGYLVDAQPEPLAGRITALLDDPSLAEAMGRAGKAWVEREWQWGTSADRLRELLSKAPGR
jgi:phosphatidylinositol alpha-1,6-mannosyltransferase